MDENFYLTEDVIVRTEDLWLRTSENVYSEKLICAVFKPLRDKDGSKVPTLQSALDTANPDDPDSDFELVGGCSVKTGHIHLIASDEVVILRPAPEG
jgi:hypothetical protein